MVHLTVKLSEEANRKWSMGIQSSCDPESSRSWPQNA